MFSSFSWQVIKKGLIKVNITYFQNSIFIYWSKQFNACLSASHKTWEFWHNFIKNMLNEVFYSVKENKLFFLNCFKFLKNKIKPVHIIRGGNKDSSYDPEQNVISEDFRVLLLNSEMPMTQKVNNSWHHCSNLFWQANRYCIHHL